MVIKIIMWKIKTKTSFKYLFIAYNNNNNPITSGKVTTFLHKWRKYWEGWRWWWWDDANDDGGGDGNNGGGSRWAAHFLDPALPALWIFTTAPWDSSIIRFILPLGTQRDGLVCPRAEPRFKPRQWGSRSCVLGHDIVCTVPITDKQSQAVNHVSQGCKSRELCLATQNTECLQNGKGWVYSVLCWLNIWSGRIKWHRLSREPKLMGPEIKLMEIALIVIILECVQFTKPFSICELI